VATPWPTIFEAIAILEIGDLFSVGNRNDQPAQVWSWDKGRGKNQMRLENVHFVSRLFWFWSPIIHEKDRN